MDSHSSGVGKRFVFTFLYRRRPRRKLWGRDERVGVREAGGSESVGVSCHPRVCGKCVKVRCCVVQRYGEDRNGILERAIRASEAEFLMDHREHSIATDHD